MPIASLLNLDCTVTAVSSTTADAEGNPVNVQATSSVKCHIAQQSTDETEGGRARGARVGLVMNESRWRIFLPAGTSVDNGDSVTVAGVVYQVDGTPWPVVNARSGEVAHIEADLIRVVRA